MTFGVCPNSGKWIMPASEGNEYRYCSSVLKMRERSDFVEQEQV